VAVAITLPAPVSWEEADPANRAMVDQRDARLRELVDELGPVHRALDLGCGRGEVLPALGLPGVGVDLSVLRLRLAPGPVAQADATRLPFPDDRFDVLLDINVLSSIPGDLQRDAVAGEIRRVLAPGGSVLWYDQKWPNPGNRSTRPVTVGHLRALFPGADLALEPITVVPALARALPRQYDRLHATRLLRSHLIGRIRPR
jgi:SAM-dependent methyltransferase